MFKSVQATQVVEPGVADPAAFDEQLPQARQVAQRR
jgi:hypothetical protein